MEELISTAKKLKSLKKEIIYQWKDEVRESLSSAAHGQESILKDSIPEFLDFITQALETNLAEVRNDIHQIASFHGAIRVNKSNYTIEDTLSEYSILRRIIFSCLENDGPLPFKARDLILEVISMAQKAAGKEFTKKLEIEKAKLQSVLDQLPASVWIANAPSGEIITSNKYGRDQISQKEVDAKDVEDYGKYVGYTLEGKKLEAEDWPLARSLKGETVRNEILRERRSDGREAFLRVDAGPIKDSNGKIIAGIAIGTDITDLKRTEQELHTMFEFSGTGKIVRDSATGKFLKINKTFCKMLGYSSEELLNMSVLDVTASDDKEGSGNKKTKQTFIKRFVRRDGTLFWGEVHTAPLPQSEESEAREICTVIDISDRKKSEEKLKLALEIAKIGIWSLDFSTRTVSLSPEEAIIFGYDPSKTEISLDEINQRVHPDDLEKFKKATYEHFKSSTKNDFIEFRIVLEDGSIRWLMGSGITIKNDRNEPIGIMGTNLDITDRKNWENYLNKSKEKLKSITDIQPTLISYINRDFTYEFVNKTYEDWFNIKGDLIDGKRIDEVIGKDAFELLSQKLESAFEGQRIEFDTYVPYRTGLRFVHAIYHPDVAEDGRVRGVFVSIDDRTEHKNYLESIKSNEQQFISLANSIPQLVWMAHPDGSIFWYNQRWYEYIGSSGGHPEFSDEVIDLFKHHIAKGTIWEETFPIKSGNGEWRWFLSRAMPLKNEEGLITRWFGTSTDITEQKNLTDNLNAEQILRDKIVSTLSHDLRTPLTAAKISSQIIRRNSKEENTQHLAHKIRENLDRADEMIKDLLDANKIRAGGGIKIDIQKLDIVEVARKTLEEMATIHGNRFVLNAPEQLVAYLCWDGMRRILENLCSNAIKYGSPYDPIKISITHRGNDVYISVKNRGNPLINIDREKLFEPFKQGEGVPNKSGWGIGLTIVKGVTEAHGGKVTVNTSEEGTTFQIIVPQDAREKKSITQASVH